MEVQHFYEPKTGTLTYVVHDGETCVVVDPLRDYVLETGTVGWQSANEAATYIDCLGLSVDYVIDSHAHADHLSGLPFFRQRYGARTVTGVGIAEIEPTFADPYEVSGCQTFDLLVDEGDVLTAGSLRIEVIATPGHTANHLCFKIADAIFVGDTLFMPDYGTARCDFPGGSAATLYDSIQRLYQYPDATRLFMGHDYPPEGRPFRCETTVGEQKRHNIHLQAETSKEDFVALREARDAQLDMPHLFWPSMQVNVQAGELPGPAPNGVAYFKIPIRNSDSLMSPSTGETSTRNALRHEV